MSEDAIKRQLRGRRSDTASILDDESFNVGEAVGKLAHVFDFIRFDKGCHKLVRVCLDYVTRQELDRILTFQDGRDESGTIIQLFFWHAGDRKPFYRPKLYYGRPRQTIPGELLKLVK